MQVKDNKLVDLYRRFINFVTTNYPDAVVTENKKSVMINYPGELARIFVYVDKPTSSLLVKIAKDITQKMSDTNGRIYYLSSIDELNTLKSGIQVIMDMKMPAGVPPVATSVSEEMEAEDCSQGYLYDCNKQPIGVVYIDRIPTNAFVHSSDKINMPVELDEEEPSIQAEQRRGTIAKFFKR